MPERRVPLVVRNGEQNVPQGGNAGNLPGLRLVEPRFVERRYDTKQHDIERKRNPFRRDAGQALERIQPFGN
ncbi:hypothetical protein SDC9_125160 [bioreactor metagenome]|uniref:Uncharacterized protein n=1 Tax=bioreactor metagenome TaxID=1076179 RepID=A0A645CMM8_9ZZZZ